MKDKKYVQGLVTGVTVTLAIVALILGITFFRFRESYRILMNKTETVKEISNSEKTIFSKIKHLMGIIDERSIYKPDDKEVVEGIYKGIFNSLGDKYSCYYTADEYEKLMDSIEGNYVGIGAYVGVNDSGYSYIVQPMKQSPAEKAGLKTGDVIYKVDDVNVLEKTSEEVVAMIKGEEGTKVKITVAREEESDYLDFVITRKEIESQTVDYEVKKDNIGYIAVGSFDSVTTKQFENAIDELTKKKVSGLVIDLRNNPGGNLDVVVDMLDLFVKKGDLIVYTEDKNGKKTSEYCAKGDKKVNLPLAVLVNGNSASASEIFAGAVKDYKLGKIVGDTTFGKGIVQTVTRLNDGSAIRFTIAKYFTPSGKNIHEKGIKPDVKVDFSTKEYTENNIDTQLDMALNLVKDAK